MDQPSADPPRSSEAAPLAEPQCFYPNKMGRIILLALEEMIGHNGVNAALNLAHLRHLVNNYPPNNLDRQFSFDEIGRIQKSLDGLYGPRGGRALALRAGRACFQHGLREFGPRLGVADLAFRLLPLSMKLRSGAEVFAETFNNYTDQIVRLQEDDDRLLWIIERCPLCWGRRAGAPCCHLAVGILQESLLWVSGGKNFNVQETTCIACGDDACTIAVDKQALD